MDEYKRDDQHISSLITTTLSVTVIILLGVMGYAYYTKDITPKNKIVKFFSSEKMSFNDLPQSEQEKYILKSSPLEVLKPLEEEKREIVQQLPNEIEEEIVPNKFLEKMAKMQKDTDEMVLEGKTKVPAKVEEVTPANRFLEKMATMQKDTDEMVIDGKRKPSIVEEEQKPKNKFLEKMAKKQKETDEMIIRSNSN